MYLVFQFMAVTNFVLMVQGEVHGSFLSGNCTPRKDTIGRGYRGDSDQF